MFASLRNSGFALLCLVQLSFAHAIAFQKTDITRGALEVEVQKLDLTDGFIEHHIINATNAPLTAIAYNIVVLYRDGSRFEDPTVFECIYSAHLPRPVDAPALHPGKGAIWPGQAVYFRDKITEKAGTQVVTAYIEPQAAVMMDRRAVGDRDILRRISDGRRGFYEALTTWTPAFEQTLINTQFGEDPVSALDQLVQTVEGTSSHRGALTRPQQKLAEAYKRLLQLDATTILKTSKSSGESGIGQLSQQVERYRAQLMAAQDSWKLIEIGRPEK